MKAPAYLLETIAFIGLADQVITRADCFLAFVGAGFSLADADQQAFGFAQPRQGVPHPRAREAMAIMLTDASDTRWRDILYSEAA